MDATTVMASAPATDPAVEARTGASMPLIQAVPDTGGVTLRWADGTQSYFHFIWLRDCCYCERCGDSLSSLRVYVPCDVPLDIRASETSIDADGSLIVVWNDSERHRSRYSAQWLFRHRYDDAARAARRPRPVLWSASVETAPHTFEFDTVRDSDAARLSMYRSIRDLGFAIVTGGPAHDGAVRVVANLVGDVTQSSYGDVFDLRPGAEAGTAGTTKRAVAPHTDEVFAYTPPGILSLHCIRKAEDGGDTVLVDGFAIAEQVRAALPEPFALLARFNHAFIRLHDGTLDLRAQVPAITLDDDGTVCGVRLHTRASAPLDVPSDVLEDYYAAYRALTEAMLDPLNQVEVSLRSGDSVVFDNHRILHARTAFSDPSRFLQICSVMRERFHERYRLLASRLGRHDEASCVLSPGTAR